MPNIFPVPKSWPVEVSSQLRASFQLFWVDEAASANRLRASVERLLDHIGVRRRNRVKNVYASLSLQKRIEMLSHTQSEAANSLMAVKWLGNTGTHESNVDKRELLLAYEVMEHAVEALLGERRKRIATIARRLNKRHARVKRKKK